jgi:quinol monooxygenase YgiN
MKKSTTAFHHILLLILIGMLASSCGNTYAQGNKPHVRIVKMIVDSLQLDNFRSALKEHAESAIKTDPGVLTFYAVYDKDQPNNVTVFEIYAGLAAYESHIQTPHHIKYISTVKNMVALLVFTDVIPIALETKLK